MFCRKKHVHDYNFNKLIENYQTIAEIEAKHDDTRGKLTFIVHCRCLVPLLLLSQKSRVFCTHNLWPEIGVRNGALGIVEDIIYAPGHGPPKTFTHSCCRQIRQIH